MVSHRKKEYSIIGEENKSVKIGNNPEFQILLDQINKAAAAKTPAPTPA